MRKLNFEICDSFVQGKNVFFEPALAEYEVQRGPGRENSFLKFAIVLSKENVFFDQHWQTTMCSEDRDEKTQF